MNFSARIVIIGAGASGIAAATKLLKYGFKNVTILEAQDRIGGRIHTIPFGDNFIDLGAQWCHGEENNVVYELVRDKNVLDSTGSVYYDYKCIRSNGDVVPDDVTEKLKEILDKAYEDKDDLLKNYNGSLGTYYKDSQTTTIPSIDRKIAYEFLEVHQKFAASYEGALSIYDVSGKGNLDYYTCEGDPVLNWKDIGFMTLLNVLMESNGRDFGILNKRILLNKDVSKISWDKKGIKPVKIKCTSGIEIEADHVISTVSLGVLKNSFEEIFEPELPGNKYRAIKGLGFGTVDKVFIHFPEKWWDDDFLGFTCQWRENDLKELRKSDFSWLEDVFGFYVVRYQPNVLSSWVVGQSALDVEKLPKSKQMEGIIYLLRRFLKKPDIPQPIDFIITSWHSNPYFRGSYSHRSMDTEKLYTGARDLANPIIESNGSPILLFAGEATHDHYYSTVHGAVETGWREADSICEFCTTKKSFSKIEL
uniref:Amine oxidase domain-containing protein n=1 Tax=Megaselia scalaris TaxID=36166 RepID=T1H025_MEGSC